MTWNCSVVKFDMSSPDDMSGFEKLLSDGTIRAQEVVGIIAKTEGNGRVNDFSRPLAHRCFRDVLARVTRSTAAEIEMRGRFRDVWRVRRDYYSPRNRLCEAAQ